ncbi:hypothetical protein DES40_2518 [Litorimonas taeanensis]|uniref:Uncharacterized protein n=1 Tax=Litorimonas taeanensis TaxID=568099 RepID=A0A420WFE0_9PROT|nr:hypothetical protein DES40_2518 [Litorimonas taeanensis]
MAVNMTNESTLQKLESINQRIWDIISDLHDDVSIEKKSIKNSLIRTSGDLCVELIIPLEKAITKDKVD